MLPRTKKEVDAWLDKMLRDFCRDWAEKEEKLKKRVDGSINEGRMKKQRGRTGSNPVVSILFNRK
jgi:hypothetical protein